MFFCIQSTFCLYHKATVINWPQTLYTKQMEITSERKLTKLLKYFLVCFDYKKLPSVPKTRKMVSKCIK